MNFRNLRASLILSNHPMLRSFLLHIFQNYLHIKLKRINQPNSTTPNQNNKSQVEVQQTKRKFSLKNLGTQLSDLVGQATGGEGLVNRIVKGATTVISGANIVFPKIWTDSNFSRSFNIEVSLKTPYGNPESIFTDIMVPLAHWLALAAPRQRSINTYGSPFLVKFFIPGFCAVDMGMVSSLTISKGGDGSAWSADGLPLEMNLSITIEDLCPHLSISRINGVSFRDAYNMLWNGALLDYVAVLSGLDLRQTDHAKRSELAEALAKNSAGDMVNNKIKETLIEDVSNMLSKASNSPLSAGLGAIGRMIGL